MILFIYILGMVLHYGFLFAYWQRKWPLIADGMYGKDMGIAMFFSLIWPVTILVSVLERDNIYKYGLKFW